MYLCEFKASPVYRASFGTAKATQRNLVSGVGHMGHIKDAELKENM